MFKFYLFSETIFFLFFFDPKCSSVNTISSGKCDFVKTTEDCSYDGFLFNYMEMAYCHFQDNRVASFFILILVLLILFISIGIVADEL